MSTDENVVSTGSTTEGGSTTEDDVVSTGSTTDQDGSTTEDGSTTDEQAPQRPILRIVNGDATPEEVAAIVAVFASLQTAAPGPKRRTPEWSAHHRQVRRTLAHGPGGWRSSALPR